MVNSLRSLETGLETPLDSCKKLGRLRQKYVVTSVALRQKSSPHSAANSFSTHIRPIPALQGVAASLDCSSKASGPNVPGNRW